MKNSKHKLSSHMIIALLFATALFSCRKQDILPEPVGEPVPYKSPDKTWEQLMNESSNTYFKQAWQRSHMNDVLKKFASTYYTVFVPTDKAFQQAGWTTDKISAVAIETLDTLLSNYVVPGRFLPEAFETIKGNQALRTLAERSDLPNYPYSTKTYVGYLFAGKHNDSLYVNGASANKWGATVEGTNGIMYSIEKLVPRPEKTMWQYLEDDPKFSFFITAMLVSDSLYQSDWRSINYIMSVQGGSDVPQFTLFAPTNEAFKKFGLQSEEDVREYCMRVWPLPYPDYDENWYYQDPTTSMDSILFPHGLQMFRAYMDGKGCGPVYFTNDLVDNANVLSNIKLMEGSLYSSPPLNISLAFSSAGEDPLVKRFGSTASPVRLSEKNIRVTNGVIHVVDELFVP